MLHLYQAAEVRWRSRCPCCDRPMVRHRNTRKGHRQPKDNKTMGHDQAVSLGGDVHQWLFMCHGCNNEQGWLSFAAWARMLILADDPRADKVVEVARFIDAWREKRRLAA